jgi:hypothetical protein
MTPEQHARAAERLFADAALFAAGGYNSPEARLRCVTMARAKEIQAQWHKRRAVGAGGSPQYVQHYVSWSLA